jgi:hypothetical protein
VYAAGLGPCVDAARGCSSLARLWSEACWGVVPSRVKWLCCGVDTFTLAHEHGFKAGGLSSHTVWVDSPRAPGFGLPHS